jgi:hypothetical protein
MSAEPTNRRLHPLRGWWPLIAVSVAAPLLLLVPNELRNAVPAWAWAWALIFAFFGAMKLLTWRRTPAPKASLWLQLGYLFAWPGLDARTFFHSTAARDEPVDPRVGVVALGKLLLGAALFWCAARIVPFDWPLLRGWVGVVAVAIGILGGFFQMLSWLWRAGGVDARPIMNRPLRSTSLNDFWSRRWNLAFHDFAERFLYRPLAARFNRAVATVGVFAFSGLLHEAVLSLPAGGGYGGPSLFFLAQLIGVAYERDSNFYRALQSSWADASIVRGYAVIFLICPAGLLFHRPFIERVWLPFMHAVGAL